MTGRQIGFVGLGVMGGAMAGHVLKSAGSLIVYNRTAAKADALVQSGASFEPLERLSAVCDVVLLCVSRTEDVAECLQQMSELREGSLVVDHSTIAPHGARQFHAELAAKGIRFVDAPVTGGSVGAKNGQLTIFLGGNEEDVEEAKRAAEPYTKRAERVGGPGMGQTAKMANQIAVAGTLLSLCESMAFASKAGLDLAQIKGLVGGGAGGSWCYEVYGQKILDEDWSPGFSITNQAKDLRYCREAAKAIGALTPASDLTLRLLERMERAGHGDWTTAALYREYLELTSVAEATAG